MTIRHVRQEDSNGCGVACLAMVTGQDYRTVRSWFRVRAWQNARWDGRTLDELTREVIEPHDFARHGITHWEVQQFLAEHGYASALLWKDRRPDDPRAVWPEAFAETHIVSVQVVTGNHYVVWLSDGRVLDPSGGETTLSDPCFAGVQHILGVCRIQRCVA